MPLNEDWERQVRTEANALMDCDRRHFVYGYNLHSGWFDFLCDQQVRQAGWAPLMRLLDDADEALRLQVAVLTSRVDEPQTLEVLRGLRTSSDRFIAHRARVELDKVENPFWLRFGGAKPPVDVGSREGVFRDPASEPAVPSNAFITSLVEALIIAAYEFYGLGMNGGAAYAMDTADSELLANAYAAYTAFGMSEAADIVATGHAYLGGGDIVASTATEEQWQDLVDRFTVAFDTDNDLDRAIDAYLLSAPGGH